MGRTGSARGAARVTLMLPLTTVGLLCVMPNAGERIARFVGPLNQALAKFDICTPERVAAFLAQVAHESGELAHLEENLNYSAEALLRVWPNRFTSDEAIACARQPERIANRVYADRLGNGPPESGDGWLYRGRGLLQITGRTNYRYCSIAIAGDADTLLLNPERLTWPAYACESAAWFWAARGLNELADRGGFREITYRINGGLNGLKERVAYWDRAIGVSAA
jgi:putative chitinase